ncbi:MAG: hypothetical protein H7Z72_09950 [Bacteroidetes bacterium]|nr:hypothetical protein [Fibrella sp.]
MKSFILLLLLGGAASSSGAQAQNSLANTAWQGQANVPDEATIILHFKTDTVYMYIYPDMYLGETMVYTAKADTLTLQKTSGNSPCDTQGVGTLQFALKDDAMTLKPIMDDCRDRKAAWVDKPFKKVAVPVK